MNKKLLTLLCITLLLSYIPATQYTYTVTADQTVYITNTGSKYHTHPCGRGNYFTTSLSSAQSRGLDACAKCYPGGAPSSKPKVSTSVKDSVKTAAAKKMKLNMKTKALIVGQTCKIKAKHTSGKVSFKSSNSKVAKVTSKGKVTAKKKGKTTITVRSGTQKKTCKITVEDPELNKTSLQMNVGDESILKLYGCKHADDIDWDTSDDTVVYEEEGELLAEGPGTATITAKVHGKKFKCKVTVVENLNEQGQQNQPME